MDEPPPRHHRLLRAPATPSAFARSDATVSWAQPQIRYVVKHGLMAKTVAAFRADDTLTQGELAAVIAG